MIYYKPLVKIIETSHREYGREGRGQWVDELDMWIVMFTDHKKPCAALCLATDITVLYVGEERPERGDVWQN